MSSLSAAVNHRALRGADASDDSLSVSFDSLRESRNNDLLRDSSRCQLSLDAAAPTSLKLNCNAKKIRFAGIGDWGEKTTNAGLNAVRDALHGVAGSLDFVVSVGDNFYSSGVSSVTDSQWTNTWVSRYGIGSTLTVPWFSLLGNHDHKGQLAGAG
ncbi:hypothetical protein PINS_up006564 [Pythium insidiosum]|nr:hypothetical protein PINS_up006564 [Pythium insidiosum]